jgi:hypothetical protein
MDIQQDNPSRPSGFEERYRLYLDESGDHVYRETNDIPHRFLCLLGCWFKNPDYIAFHKSLENLKSKYFGHHPDEPIILHREDIINCRRAFKILQNEGVRQPFDNDLIAIIKKASFVVVAVAIDKNRLRAEYGHESAHPYHLAMGFMLQRYAGYMNHINRTGDIMAESRGGVEDRLLAESYTRIFERGTWMTDTSFFQNALSSRQLKLKQKSSNISGLQLSDLLGHPVKQHVLSRYGFINDDTIGEFAKRLQPTFESKFNRHLYDGRVEGYGYVLYPKK